MPLLQCFKEVFLNCVIFHGSGILCAFRMYDASFVGTTVSYQNSASNKPYRLLSNETTNQPFRLYAMVTIMDALVIWISVFIMFVCCTASEHIRPFWVPTTSLLADILYYISKPLPSSSFELLSSLLFGVQVAGGVSILPTTFHLVYSYLSYLLLQLTNLPPHITSYSYTLRLIRCIRL